MDICFTKALESITNFILINMSPLYCLVSWNILDYYMPLNQFNKNGKSNFSLNFS